MGHFIIGSVAGWLLLSILFGRLLPAGSFWAFLAGMVGGVIGVAVGEVGSTDKGE